MGIKRRYRNFVEKFLSQDGGKRFFQFFYSWGAAVVIIGALAKLMHWPYGLGNILLTVGLLTEFLVFFISAFDRPPKEYKWEEVFPVLDSKDPEDRPQFAGNGVSGGGVIVGGTGDSLAVADGISGGMVGGMVGGVSGPVVIGGVGGGFSGSGPVNIPEEMLKKSFGIPSNIDITEEDTNALTASIKKLSEASEQLAKMSELTEATQQYLTQMASVSENMQKFNDVTSNLTHVSDDLLHSYRNLSDNSGEVLTHMVSASDNIRKFSNVTNNLTDASDILLNSYKNLTDNSGGIEENSRGYIEQMDALNRNISNLNNMYELQLLSVNSQMDAVNRINAGLLRIKEMYEGSVVDSSIFRSETERMTQQISALNNVYTRLLNAMTMNVQAGFGGAPAPAPAPSYGNPGYANPGYYNPGYTTPPPAAGGYNPNPGMENKEKKS